MRLHVKQFALREEGFATIDWVAITAAVVGLGMAVILTLGDATTSLATDMEDELDTVKVTLNGGK